MLTGAYGYPSPTITGEVDRDIMFVEKVLGVKLAISDHRAPNVTESELIQLASKTRTAGMLSGNLESWCCIWEMQMLDCRRCLKLWKEYDSDQDFPSDACEPQKRSSGRGLSVA